MSRKTLAQTTLISILLLSGIAANTSSVMALNYINNGSFENTNGTFVDNGNRAMSVPIGSTTIPSWQVIDGEIAWIQSPNPNYAVMTPYGSFFLDLTGYHDSIPYGGVTQNINTVVGGDYILSFSLGFRNNNFYPSGGPVSAMATAGSTSQIFTTDSLGTDNQWRNFQMLFNATSSTTTISIAGNSAAGVYIGLDNVSVTPVPFEFSLGQGFLLGTPLFIGLRIYKKKKAASLN